MSRPPIRLLLDDNLSERTREFLVSLGFDVTRAKDELGRGALNGDVAEVAERTLRVLVTLDLDFGPIHARRRGTLTVILVRHKLPTPANVNRLLGRLFREDVTDASRLEGTLVVVSEMKTRFRKL